MSIILSKRFILNSFITGPKYLLYLSKFNPSTLGYHLLCNRDNYKAALLASLGPKIDVDRTQFVEL